MLRILRVNGQIILPSVMGPLWCCYILTDKGNGCRTNRKSAKCLSVDGSCLSNGEDRCGSRKERIRTEQVTDKERPTNVCVTDV